jgi:hypothetical protein
MLRLRWLGLSGSLLVMLLVAVFLAGCTQQVQTPAPTPSPTPATTDTATKPPNSNNIAATTYGSKSAALKTSWTLAEMLQYAIEDEYMARAEYKYVIATLGDQNPFSNILAAEETHINALKGLYTIRNMPIPEDKSAQYLIKPTTIKDALSLGIEAEIANINMYKGFLATPNLPDDSKTVFTQLQAASESHLSAFKNVLQRYQ